MTPTSDIKDYEAELDQIIDIFRPLIADQPGEYQAHLLSQCRHELKPLLAKQATSIRERLVEEILRGRETLLDTSTDRMIKRPDGSYAHPFVEAVRVANITKLSSPKEGK